MKTNQCILKNSHNQLGQAREQEIKGLLENQSFQRLQLVLYHQVYHADLDLSVLRICTGHLVVLSYEAGREERKVTH